MEIVSLASQSQDKPNDLHEFLNFLYEGLDGYIYVATKDPQNHEDWTTDFFSYPTEVSQAQTFINAQNASRDVYVSPALYNAKRATRFNVKASNVVWTEFDGNAPQLDDFEVPPSLIVQSSGSDNQHVYWRLLEPITEWETLEQINRNITFALEADASGWEANQVLRPPNTVNHKYDNKPKTALTYSQDVKYDPELFDSYYPTAPVGPDSASFQLGLLPEPADVVMKYAFTPDMMILMSKEAHEVQDRSASLMNLAYGCCQMGMTDPEVFVMLILADDRWGKFKNRQDRYKRLSHIVTRARHKYPDSENGSETFALVMDFMTMLESEVNIDWVIEPMLMETGTMMMVGPSGIGKTQLSMQFMFHLALGRDFLHYKINKPQKILFLSLEMSFGEIQQFGLDMIKSYSEEDQTVIRENFIIVPLGEKWPLNLPDGQSRLERLVETYAPNGVFVDSVGSAIQGNLTDDEQVQSFLDFNDRLRNRYGVFTWYIHHMRKSTNNGPQPASQDDVYGNQYFVNRSSSAYGILRGKGGLLKVRNFKLRMAKKEEDYLLRRVDHLNFEKETAEVEESIIYKKPEDEKGPVKHGNFDL